MANYNEKFSKILTALGARQIEFEELCSEFAVSEATVKKHLKLFINQNPKYLVNILGFYPSPETIIRLVEDKIGLITSDKLLQANFESKSIIDSITKPKHTRFLSQLLGEDLAKSVEQSRLIDKIYDEYAPFVREADNGLVSLAGGLNEKLFIRSLENIGLISGADFIKTGKDSDGDLVVYEKVGSKRRLTVEIKSYNARERLLRGLQDAQKPKVGIGFFRRADEFNPERTQTLLGAEPMAIYMPQDTYLALTDKSKKFITATQDVLYRPLELFAADMHSFTIHGQLTPLKAPWHTN